jgi:NAD(P)-dependent dehydrogenase (short-subunit alcohol dehydrogenase family)
MRLEGRRILITGGASGIGLAAAERFVREGARVCVLDRNAETLAQAAPRLEGVLAVVCDVSRPDEVAAAVERAAAHMQGIDGVANVAGIAVRKSFDELDIELMSHAIAVNLLGPFSVAKAALPHLRAAGGGTIVNVASGVALRPIAGQAAYASSKGGLIVMTKAMAIDLAPDNIRVNVVCPGIIETPMITGSAIGKRYTPEQVEKLMERRLIRRFGQPEEVVDALLYLTSDESSYVTATVLAVDGGGTMH